MKTRTLNELRQEKNYGYKPPKTKKDNIEATKALIINNLKKALELVQTL